MTEEREIINYLKNKGLHIVGEKFVTILDLSNFLDVSIESIKTIIKRNRSHFGKNEKIIVDKKDKTLCEIFQSREHKHAPKLTIFNYIGVLKIIVLLRSETALEIKEYMLVNHKNLYQKIQKENHPDYIFFKRYERELGFLLHNIFDRTHIVEEQVYVGKYKIDFVIDNKLAIECDEDGHSHYDKEKEITRENFIKKNNYEILRYDTRNDNMLEFVGKVSDYLVKLSIA